MTYSQQVQNMCPITKGPKHGPAPIPEEGAWVKAYEVKDISGYTHGVGWCAPQQVTCKLSLNIKNGVIEEALVETIGTGRRSRTHNHSRGKTRACRLVGADRRRDIRQRGGPCMVRNRPGNRRPHRHRAYRNRPCGQDSGCTHNIPMRIPRRKNPRRIRNPAGNIGILQRRILAAHNQPSDTFPLRRCHAPTLRPYFCNASQSISFRRAILSPVTEEMNIVGIPSGR